VLLVTALTMLAGVAAAVPAYLVARHDTPTAMDLPRVSGLPADMPTSPASLRGKVVVLRFMDPHCTDICPLVSQATWGHGIALLARHLLN